MGAGRYLRTHSGALKCASRASCFDGHAFTRTAAQPSAAQTIDAQGGAARSTRFRARHLAREPRSRNVATNNAPASRLGTAARMQADMRTRIATRMPKLKSADVLGFSREHVSDGPLLCPRAHTP